MQYARIDGQPQEAAPGLKGFCPVCDNTVLPKCGRVRLKHWSHYGDRDCDSFNKEPETQWHRDWKGLFPLLWREVCQTAANGEKHRADVKTANEWVFEFQHSPIELEERQSREAFYSKLIWVVDGTHLKRAKKQFFRVWEEGTWVSENPALRKISFPQECELLRNWLGCRAPVFFDLGEGTTRIDSTFWCLLPAGPDGGTYVAGFNRANLINYHRSEVTHTPDFTELLNNHKKMISNYIAQLEMARHQQFAQQTRYGDPLSIIQQQQARMRWAQRRRRF